MIATPLGKAIFQSRGRSLIFLLRDDFTTPQAAPLTSPRTCEPGPGTLTITDTNSKLSVASGNLVFATGGVAAGDPGAWTSASLARIAGRTVVAKTAVTVGTIEMGFDASQSGTIIDCIRHGTSTIGIRDAGTVLTLDTTVAGTEYQFAVILREAGFLAFIKGGIYTQWMLFWVGVAAGTPRYPALSAGATTSVGTLDNFRVIDLPSPFDTRYGIATQQLAGAQSAGVTFVHEANCVLECIATTLPSAGNVRVDFRMQDVDNKWQIRWSSAGTLILDEFVAGVATSRGSVSSIVANGHRIVVVADGTTIRVYSNNVLRITYASASNFATATEGVLNTLSTGGAVSDIISWPRVVPSAAAALLNAAVA